MLTLLLNLSVVIHLALTLWMMADLSAPVNNREAREIVEPFAEAGATWWVESMWGYKNLREVRHRIRAGPPMKSQARSV